MYHSPVSATLIPANNVILFAGSASDLDAASGTVETNDVSGYFSPPDAVIEMGPDALFSIPVRAIKQVGQLTAVIVPQGVELEPVTLSGSDLSIEAADTSARFE